MRFCCINGDGWVKTGTNRECQGPKKGDIVTKTYEYGLNGVLYYKFKEWPDEEGFNARCFIPINEPSQQETMKEVEFMEIKKEVPISSN